MFYVMRWVICLFMFVTLASEEMLTDRQKHLIQEAMRSAPELIPTKPLGLTIKGKFKTKYNAKGVSSRKHTLKEENLFDAKEIHIPQGIEFVENFVANCAFGDYLKFLSEFKFTEKYLNNRYDPTKLPKLNNVIKCKLGLTLTPWNFFEFESFLEEKLSRTHTIDGMQVQPVRIKDEKKGFQFDQYTIKFKFKY